MAPSVLKTNYVAFTVHLHRQLKEFRYIMVHREKFFSEQFNELHYFNLFKLIYLNEKHCKEFIKKYGVRSIYPFTSSLIQNN